MKLIEQLKCNDYGTTDSEPIVKINLQSLWDINPVEDKFISNYCKIVHHEYLHYALYDILQELFIDYEEFFVGRLSGTDHLDFVSVKDKYLWQVL